MIAIKAIILHTFRVQGSSFKLQDGRGNSRGRGVAGSGIRRRRRSYTCGSWSLACVSQGEGVSGVASVQKGTGESCTVSSCGGGYCGGNWTCMIAWRFAGPQPPLEARFASLSSCLLLLPLLLATAVRKLVARTSIS